MVIWASWFIAKENSAETTEGPKQDRQDKAHLLPVVSVASESAPFLSLLPWSLCDFDTVIPNQFCCYAVVWATACRLNLYLAASRTVHSYYATPPLHT